MSWHSWRRSFRFAYEGILTGLQEERNLRVHFIAAIAILLVCYWLQLNGLKLLFIYLVIVLVIIAELINTAIERTIDLTTPYLHPLARIAKDTAAAAVLVTAVFAIGAGFILLGEPIVLLLMGKFSKMEMNAFERMWVISSLVLLIFLWLHGTALSNASVRPHLGLGLLFGNAIQMFELTNLALTGIVGGIICLLYLLWVARYQRVAWRRYLSGAVLGSCIALVTHLLDFVLPG